MLRRREDGLILLVRRDAAGRVLWQQPVPGLPARFGAFNARYVAGGAASRSLLVATFLPGDHCKMAPYGRIVEVDEAGGRLRALGGVARPRTMEWIADEVFEFHGALRLAGDRVVLYGGFGTGPHQWWIASMTLDGTLLWYAMGRTSAGEVTSLRAVPGGFEASVHLIMAWPDESNVGVFRMRFDDAGRLVGGVKMTGNGALLLAADGSAATIGEGEPPTLIIEDRHGRRTLAALPAGAHLRYRLDDGSWVLFDDSDHDLVVTADGRAAFHVERDVGHEAILADGSILSATCADKDCRARDLTFCRRPW